MMPVKEIPAASVEFVTVWVDSRGSATLTTQPVAIAFQSCGTSPGTGTIWITAAWTGAQGLARAARALIGPGTGNVIGKGIWEVWAKVTDNPESPVFFCGQVKVF
jgi:hypothetical protein